MSISHAIPVNSTLGEEKIRTNHVPKILTKGARTIKSKLFHAKNAVTESEFWTVFKQMFIWMLAFMTAYMAVLLILMLILAPFGV